MDDLYQIEYVKRRSNRIRKETVPTFKKFWKEILKFCHRVVPVGLNIEFMNEKFSEICFDCVKWLYCWLLRIVTFWELNIEVIWHVSNRIYIWYASNRICKKMIKLQVIFGNRTTNYRALLRKMTCKSKASYGSSPPCMYRIEFVKGWSNRKCKETELTFCTFGRRSAWLLMCVTGLMTHAYVFRGTLFVPVRLNIESFERLSVVKCVW